MNEAGNEFLEYIELSEAPEMITKSELMDRVRSRGGSISDRLLTFYSSEGLVPKSLRIGSRSGAYPVVVEDLILWIYAARKAGTSVAAIKELLPVWKFLKRSAKSKELNLAELELVAHRCLESWEAILGLPMLVLFALPCICDLEDTTLIDKEGIKIPLGNDPSHASIGFLVEQPNAQENGHDFVFSTRLTFPSAHPEVARRDPRTVVLELPARPGEAAEPTDPPRAARASRRR